MSIRIHCPCGQSFAAQDEHAGKRVKCPHCGRAAAVPASGAGNGAAAAPAGTAATSAPSGPSPAGGTSAAAAGKAVTLHVRGRGNVLGEGVKIEVMLDDKSLGTYSLRTGFAFGYATRSGEHTLELRYLGKVSRHELSLTQRGVYELLLKFNPAGDSYVDELEVRQPGQ
ncbi:MAG: hypothetical protein HYS13_02625 [Planctomycetia bacterium]|nr:hypothetical protein [Planctomycetia bacterium]